MSCRICCGVDGSDVSLYLLRLCCTTQTEKQSGKSTALQGPCCTNDEVFHTALSTGKKGRDSRSNRPAGLEERH